MQLLIVKRDIGQSTKYELSKSKALGGYIVLMELIKYAPESAKEKISRIYNNTFSTHSDNINVIKFNMLPVAQPKKEED